MIRLALWTCLAIGALLYPGQGLAQAAMPGAMTYIYPPPESNDDKRLTYYWELLKSALDVTTPKWGAYVLEASPVQMNADRSQMLLVESKTISVIARTTSIEREILMRPIFIPLDKGLTGYRLFLIQKPTQVRLSQVRTLDDLKAFSIGQSSRWVDTEILRQAGLTVEPGSTYESLFKMLQLGRFDLFSRGINEIGNELKVGKDTNSELAIEQNLMLYYPLPRYYFFSRTADGERLAQRVEEGLQQLKANGQFDRQYRAFKREVLTGLHLSGRRLFRINNPTLSPQTPLARSEYWDTLTDELKAPR